jgi:hypothetical protein
MRRLGGLIGSLWALALTGCIYGFAGGGLPPHIHTMALSTFDNQTPAPEIPKELYDQMHKELQKRLGVRDAPADKADAIIRGTITSYDADVPISFSSNPNQAVSARRKLQITVDVEIVDQSTGKVLLKKAGLREEADYNERAEQDGRLQAIQKIVNEIVAGVQSNW